MAWNISSVLRARLAVQKMKWKIPLGKEMKKKLGKLPLFSYSDSPLQLD